MPNDRSPQPPSAEGETEHRTALVKLAAAVVVLVGGIVTLLNSCNSSPAQVLISIPTSTSTPTSTTGGRLVPTTTAADSSDSAAASSTTLSASSTPAPATGLAPAATASVTDVIAEPRFLYLNSMDSVGTSLTALQAGSFYINAKNYPNSVFGYIPCGQNRWTEYDLGRQWKTLHAVVGVSDQSSSDAVAAFQVFVDGSPATTTIDVGFGHSEEINVTVTGGLRLRLAIEGVSACAGSSNNVAVWGDAQLSQ
jgi:hypothetical protein